MTDPYFFDPLQLWRDAVSKLEKSANERANAQLKAPGVARSLQDAATVSFGLQQAYAKAAENYLRQAHLPSRKQIQELAETLQRIEGKLDGLVPVVEGPRPSRTRRPSAESTAPAQVAPPPKKTPARKAAGKTRPAHRASASAGPAAVQSAPARSPRRARTRKE